MNNHGDDIYNYPGIRINFSSNIWSHADLSSLYAHLASHLNVVRNYPEPDAYSLEKMIAEKQGVGDGEILVTNGATEAIHLIRTLLVDYAADVAQPTFAEYGKSKPGKGKVKWICNPNNPTGEYQSLHFNDADYYVVDQAYEDYTEQRMLRDRDIVKLPHVFLIHSMTKKYCIPGLRLGYIAANTKLIGKLKAIKQPWSVNALSIEAGKKLIEADINVLPDMHELLCETLRFRSELNKIEGIEALPTTTNFFLIKMKQPRSAEIKEYLVSHGILVRDCSNFEGLDGHYIRVATQMPDENNELIKWLTQYRF